VTSRVEEYLREDGSSPYKAWFDGLEPRAAAKVTTAKLRLELGNTSSVKWFDGMGEFVIDWGPGYRIYLAKDGEQLIVLLAVAPSAGSSATSIVRRLCSRSTGLARKPWPAAPVAAGRRGEVHDIDT